MKKVTWLTIAVILMTNLVWAQKQESKSTTSLSFNVDLDPDSKAEDVTFNIEAGTEVFELRILSSVRAGKVIVEIIDPADNKQGTFSVGTESSQKKGNAMGNFHKSLKEPLTGTWKVKIISTAAKGFVQIQTTARGI